MNEQPSAAQRRVETLDRASARIVTTSAWPVTCEDFSSAADFHFAAHAHSDPHVCLVIAGTLVERDGRGHRRLEPGCGRISPAGDAHELAIEGDRPLRCLIVSIASGGIDDPDMRVADGRTYVGGRGVADLSRRLLDELRWADDASPIALEMLGIEAAAMGRSARDRSPRVEAAPRWLERVRDRVRDDLSSVPTLAELAHDAGVSRAHLARTFRTRYGYTIGQYARSVRLEAARRLLLHTEVPLATVACEAGFADQSHMTRQVASRFGLPPGRLRARRTV